MLLAFLACTSGLSYRMLSLDLGQQSHLLLPCSLRIRTYFLLVLLVRRSIMWV